MIAIYFGSAVPLSSLWIVSALAVVCAGVNPVLTWATSAPPLKRGLFATALGIAILGAVVFGTVATVRGQFVISCDDWVSWPWCWLFYGDGGG